MKKLVLFAAVLMVSLFSINKANAQISFSINIGSQPVWGPTGYDHVEYYYLPDINAYYHVPTGQYIYPNGRNWVSVNSLPAQYRNFDLYSAYKVVINEPKPYLRNNVYMAKYGKYKNYRGHQTIIRDSRDSKYYVVNGHPNYNGNRTVVVNNRKPARNQKTVIKVNPQARPQQNRIASNNSRPSRDGASHGNGRR